MVGFLGGQNTLSGTGLGANVEEHATTTLKNGTVITAYFTGNGGPLQFSSLNPKTLETAILPNSLGTLGARMSDPNIYARDDGGFTVVLNFPVGNRIGDDRLSQYNYDKDGNFESANLLASGWLDVGGVYETDIGFLATYRDRSTDATTEYVGAFYNQNGKLLKTVDFTDGANVSGFTNPRPEATQLSNGNLAVVWQKSNLDGTVLQIFKPNGNKVDSEKSLGNIPLTIATQVIETHPDGGFVVAHAPVTTSTGPALLGPIVIQKYTNSGKKLGKEISFDTDGGVGARLSSFSNFDVAFTKDGLIAVAWTGSGVGGTDVYFAMLTAGGKVIVGPQVADITLNDDQLDVQFTTLKNGDLYLTFKDDATVQFQYVASIQGRFIVEPDYLYEGDGKDNNNSGTSGNDVLLGFGGDDKLTGGKGEDYIKGGKGNDDLYGDEKTDEIYGEEGGDTVSGGKGDDVLYGGAGNDLILGGAGNDQAYGGDGNDTIKGGTGADTIYGGNGKDKITAGTAASTLYGEAGKDRLIGGDGSDALWGGDANDRLIGNIGNDVLDGGEGKDKLFGGIGFDVLRGGAGNDKLFGGEGNDAFNSGTGNDREDGGAGDDTFYDSEGNDKMTGGGGADTFIFANADFGKDVITDFEFGVDKLDMGTTAYGLTLTGGEITVQEVSNGVRFKVDADNWVLVKDAVLTDFQADDYIINSPF